MKKLLRLALPVFLIIYPQIIRASAKDNCNLSFWDMKLLNIKGTGLAPELIRRNFETIQHSGPVEFYVSPNGKQVIAIQSYPSTLLNITQDELKYPTKLFEVFQTESPNAIEPKLQKAYALHHLHRLTTWAGTAWTVFTLSHPLFGFDNPIYLNELPTIILFGQWYVGKVVIDQFNTKIKKNSLEPPQDNFAVIKDRLERIKEIVNLDQPEVRAMATEAISKTLERGNHCLIVVPDFYWTTGYTVQNLMGACKQIADVSAYALIARNPTFLNLEPLKIQGPRNKNISWQSYRHPEAPRKKEIIISEDMQFIAQPVNIGITDPEVSEFRDFIRLSKTSDEIRALLTNMQGIFYKVTRPGSEDEPVGYIWSLGDSDKTVLIYPNIINSNEGPEYWEPILSKIFEK